MIDYFERKFRLRDFEVWDVRVSDQHYTLAILDEFRPATFDDFEIPYLIYKKMTSVQTMSLLHISLMNLLKMNIEKYSVNLHECLQNT